MLTPWQLLIPWFIAAKHVYMGVRACAVGLARSPCQLYLPYPFPDEKKIPYLIDCTAFNGVHVRRGNTSSESIHNNCRQNQYQSLEGKSTKYLWVLAVPSLRNPKNHNRHICSCSGWHASQTLGSPFILSKSPHHSFAVYEKQIKNVKGNLEFSYCRSIRFPQYYIWFLHRTTEMIFMI